jgi:Xaa-Pro aminopeptidase
VTYAGRIDRVREALPAAEIDALLVTNLTNVTYLTGFSGTNGQLLVWPQGAVFFSDPRYAARAADLVHAAEVAIYASRLTELLPERLGTAAVARLGIEAQTMTVAGRDDLAERLDGIEVVSTHKVVEGLRRAKDTTEQELVRRAVELSDDAFGWVLDRLAPGRSEREIALELEVHLRSQGAEDVAFEPIVASGPLAAHIHHTPSPRTLQAGDLVLLDFGALADGYRSDLTRTVVLGPATERQRVTYARVLEAQLAGIGALEAVAECRAVDRAARSVIASAGEADAFGHGLGHGVGLDIHEAPRLHYESDDDLVAGDVVTIEPGIYHGGWGGVRIEDCAVVTEGGAEVLTRAPKKELIEL